jgi:hypothetical protein
MTTSHNKRRSEMEREIEKKKKSFNRFAPKGSVTVDKHLLGHQLSRSSAQQKVISSHQLDDGTFSKKRFPLSQPEQLILHSTTRRAKQSECGQCTLTDVPFVHCRNKETPKKWMIK